MPQRAMNQQYKYKFSFVMPVYNVEDYLAETVESILAQTMDFQQNCEIIFVNDGSPDNSEEVCLRYKEQFPDNITYIKQENAGPGAARNKGISAARGKYISLLDSDDILSRDTLDEVYVFFEKHYDVIDFVAIKQRFFEARTGEHPLNYKFTTDRIVDVRKDFSHIQMSAPTSFIKAAAIRDKHLFDPTVGRYAEDARFMGELLLDKQKFGVVASPVYYYRKRQDQASSLDSAASDKFWYLETPKRALKSLVDYARRQENEIPKFIQFMVMYDLQWRYKQSLQAVLSKEELAQYKTILAELLQYIDDDIILAQREIDTGYKLFILGKKHHESVISKASRQGRKLFYNNNLIYDFVSESPTVTLETLEIKDTKVSLEGYLEGFLSKDLRLELHANGEIHAVEPDTSRVLRASKFLDEVVPGRSFFRVEIPLKALSIIEPRITDGNTFYKPSLRVRRFTYLSQAASMAYRVCGGYIVRRYSTSLVFRKYSLLHHIKCELFYEAAIAKRLKLRVFLEQFAKWRAARSTRRSTQNDDLKSKARELKWLLIPAKSMARNAYVIALRLLYFIAKPFYRRPIWLVSDRVMAADDNGEVFFRYLSTRTDVAARVYFVISKASSEYEGIKKYGRVVDFHSFRYKLLFLLSDKVISSEATDFVINAFGGRVDDFVDLFGFDFVFLQHGIIKDDISNWLNKYHKNIKMFVTSAKPEYESIVNGNYGYDENVVKLTGLPRYDLLENKPKKKLIITPTWRQDLAGGVNPKTGHRLYNPKFRSSEYFEFYQNLMNDERLLSTMKKHNMKGEFYLHPSFQQQIKDFTGNRPFKIMQMPYDYPRAKREGSVLLTDFSSVAFDFAYLKKPVLYTQFDNDKFYKTHTSQEGYFSYERDGFGPVVYNYEDTIKTLIQLIESGDGIRPKYQKRVKSFFAYDDRRNSERVCDAILTMNNEV